MQRSMLATETAEAASASAASMLGLLNCRSRNFVLLEEAPKLMSRLLARLYITLERNLFFALLALRKDQHQQCEIL